ncbi:hypothetical protein B0H11DRAFT_2263388 [Mycena galericulata]|nr:hypothetical protein B0H11DRAFT_2263388 [Mycena galericulata]
MTPTTPTPTGAGRNGDEEAGESETWEITIVTWEIMITAIKLRAIYDLKPKHEVMGSALHVSLPKGVRSGTSIDVTVFYKTTKECTALQWLDKEQTQGKRFPYLFSRCQPIHARALAPVQDSPSVKITYSATVASVLPVLSAIRVFPPFDGPTHDGKIIGEDIVKYTYDQVRMLSAGDALSTRSQGEGLAVRRGRDAARGNDYDATLAQAAYALAECWDASRAAAGVGMAGFAKRDLRRGFGLQFESHRCVKFDPSGLAPSTCTWSYSSSASPRSLSVTQPLMSEHRLRNTNGAVYEPLHSAHPDCTTAIPDICTGLMLTES